MAGWQTRGGQLSSPPGNRRRLGRHLGQDRLDDFVVRRSFRAHNFRGVFAEHFVIDVHGERTVFEDRATAEHDVVVNAVRGANPHFDAFVWRF